VPLKTVATVAPAAETTLSVNGTVAALDRAAVRAYKQ